MSFLKRCSKGLRIFIVPGINTFYFSFTIISFSAIKSSVRKYINKLSSDSKEKSVHLLMLITKGQENKYFDKVLLRELVATID